MQKGDSVMTDHPDRRSKQLIRSYGIVHEITKAGGVIIQTADGSMIKREFNSVAVYTHPPSNWDDLFRQQTIVFSQPNKQMMNRRSSQKKRQI